VISNSQPGARVEWSIGRAGQTPDIWPARTISPVEFGMDDQGRTGKVVTIVTLQKNLQGETFYGERTVQVKYLTDRDYAVANLDATAEGEPISLRDLVLLRQNSQRALRSRPVGTQKENPQTVGAALAALQAEAE